MFFVIIYFYLFKCANFLKINPLFCFFIYATVEKTKISISKEPASENVLCVAAHLLCDDWAISK